MKEFSAGNGVTAIFDKKAGTIEICSEGGTIRPDWLERAGIDRDKVISIHVKKGGRIFLPEDASGWNGQEAKYRLFGDLYNLKHIDLDGFDASRVRSMQDMFIGCAALKTLDMDDLDTSSVTNMSSVFVDCWRLTEVKCAKWNTSKVTDMSQMFCGCHSLRSLDLSSFDTSSVTDMHEMFYGCYQLTKLDLSNFDTSSVTNMNQTFAVCTS